VLPPSVNAILCEAFSRRRVQARSRGWSARRRCAELRRAHAAALRVQTAVRGHQQRRRYARQRAAAGTLQAGVRRWQVRGRLAQGPAGISGRRGGQVAGWRGWHHIMLVFKWARQSLVRKPWASASLTPWDRAAARQARGGAHRGAARGRGRGGGGRRRARARGAQGRRGQGHRRRQVRGDPGRVRAGRRRRARGGA